MRNDKVEQVYEKLEKQINHQPLSELFGLVAVTNAEKVILERIQEKQGQINMFEESEDDKDRQANELRNLIGKLPSLSIFIDDERVIIRTKLEKPSKIKGLALI